MRIAATVFGLMTGRNDEPLVRPKTLITNYSDCTVDPRLFLTVGQWWDKFMDICIPAMIQVSGDNQNFCIIFAIVYS